MTDPGAQRKDSERGQAAVEFLGVLPALLLVVLAAWQIVLAGHAARLAADAARAGARAHAVGEDARVAARSALPAGMRRGLSVSTRDDGGVTVRARMPLLVRRWSSPLRVRSTAALPAP